MINYSAEPLSFADVGRAYILEGLCGQIETSLCVRYSVPAKFSQGDCDYKRSPLKGEILSRQTVGEILHLGIYE